MLDMHFDLKYRNYLLLLSVFILLSRVSIECFLFYTNFKKIVYIMCIWLKMYHTINRNLSKSPRRSVQAIFEISQICYYLYEFSLFQDPFTVRDNTTCLVLITFFMQIHQVKIIKNAFFEIHWGWHVLNRKNSNNCWDILWTNKYRVLPPQYEYGFILNRLKLVIKRLIIQFACFENRLFNIDWLIYFSFFLQYRGRCNLGWIQGVSIF